MAEEPQDQTISRVRHDAHQLFENQETVEQILQRLDRSWKLGDEILDQIDLVSHRFESLRMFFSYLILNEARRKIFLEEAGLTDTEEAIFFQTLASKYVTLTDPLTLHGYSRSGIWNHIGSIGQEGVFYEVEEKRVAVQLSIYSEAKRLLQFRNHIDDIIWLADTLIETTNDALKQCVERQNPISAKYLSLMKDRLTIVEKAQELQRLVTTYPYIDGEQKSKQVEVE